MGDICRRLRQFSCAWDTGRCLLHWSWPCYCNNCLFQMNRPHRWRPDRRTAGIRETCSSSSFGRPRPQFAVRNTGNRKTKFYYKMWALEQFRVVIALGVLLSNLSLGYQPFIFHSFRDISVHMDGFFKFVSGLWVLEWAWQHFCGTIDGYWQKNTSLLKFVFHLNCRSHPFGRFVMLRNNL